MHMNPFVSFEEATLLLEEHGDKAGMDLLMQKCPGINDSSRAVLFQHYCASGFTKPSPAIFYASYTNAVVAGMALTSIEASKTN